MKKLNSLKKHCGVKYFFKTSLKYPVFLMLKYLLKNKINNAFHNENKLYFILEEISLSRM